MKLDIVIDQKVSYRGKGYVITRILKDLVTVVIRRLDNNEPEAAHVSELAPFEEEVVKSDPKPIESFTEKELAKARKKYEIIKPLLGEFRGNKQQVILIAKANDVGVSTLYKWISDFDTTGNIGSLVDKEGRGGKGKIKLDKEVHKILQDIIDEIRWNRRKSIKETVRIVTEKCREQGLDIPHKNTIRRRISVTDPYKKKRSLEGKDAADQVYSPIDDYPDGKYPLETVMIDHTIIDVMIVDEDTRKPLSRPWLTILIDSFSRVPLGFYLSFDPPGHYGTGRAIVHAMLGKENYIASLGLNVVWPMWGKMEWLHCDNAKEFKGDSLKMSCADYGISLKYRPVKKPWYGGRIERLMGTLNTEFRDVDGAIEPEIKIRKEFKPEATASMTLKDLEKWLTVFIADVYLHREHKALGMSPLQKWKQGINGNNSKGGIGTPSRFTVDEIRMQQDFLPTIFRTVQRKGITIDHITYYSDVLNKWINSDIVKPSGKVVDSRQFVIKRDPRDYSEILFLDPDLNKYFRIPYMNMSGPKMSKWEYKKVLKKLKENKEEINEERIFAGYRKMRELEDNARKKTKDVRKRIEREARVKEEKKIQEKKIAPPEVDSSFDDEEEDIQPFSQLEHGTFD